ncbi:AgmX/PglI C-terminal domain-containing protein [Myxococcus sp. AM009]|uniref:AgmX/PglI C-terminal domain-containing protein n=1 Tax=unclassified Myxococcus TaxID=2648731 RepID=UPI001595DC91|nr:MULTISPECIES: AgmX/PglI C-terminal domain-containing protein [unclassified Myxococcus]NVJ00557.1 AgmX/PglI C-terminal domain-containing protein [Myxococcus sp. AM009]NVJ19040.1 AgmX/PglI C-terminal domain-containing protein [Myxococcus sp. AM010]
MTRALLSAVLLASAVALAQGAAPAKAPATPAPAKRDGPDIERMPFTPDSVRQVVQHHQRRIQECYEDHMAEKDQTVEGRLMTTFTIDANGLVKDARVVKKTSTLKDPNLHDCVQAVLSSMTFPKPPDGADHPIEYPFNLKAIE